MVVQDVGLKVLIACFIIKDNLPLYNVYFRSRI
jgi:hypothetical protein